MKSRVTYWRLRPSTLALPRYTLGEIIADACVHAVGILASLGALIALMIVALPTQHALSVASLAIYGMGLVTLFVFSACYNLIPHPDWKAILRRLDHAGIFIMIAGTYTPFAILMGGAWGYGLLAAVWGVSIVGVLLKLFLPHSLDRLLTGLYLVQGWAVLVALAPLSDVLPQRALILLLVGGGLYTLGVVFHLWERLRYHNVIWHSFVLAAAGCHYAAALDGVAIAL